MIFFWCLEYYTIVNEGSTDKTYPIISWGLQYSAYILFVVSIHISAYVIKNYLIDHWEEKNLSDTPVESFRIVERDKYRVTNWKKEIDKFYKGERLISQITRDKDDMLTIHRREMRLEKNSSQKQKHSMKKKTMKK